MRLSWLGLSLIYSGFRNIWVLMLVLRELGALIAGLS